MANITDKSFANNPEIQKPRIYTPKSNVSRHYIYGYSKCIRNTNKAMMDLFSDTTIIDNDIIYPVPIIFGSHERAAIYVFGEQFVKNPDRQEAGLVDRIILPVMALNPGDISLDENRYIYHKADIQRAYGNEKRNFDVVYRFAKGIPVNFNYTLNLWSKYYEHLMQMVEQVMQKFSLVSYITIEGIPWETPVKLTGSTNNINMEVEDSQVRILKYSFSIVAEGHITQPIRRDKSVLQITKKYVILGDLMPSDTIDEQTQEVKEGETPNDK